MTGDDEVECAEAFASRLAPTGIWVATKIADLPRIFVGVSLLAIALGQAIKRLNVPAPSRASPLPQGIWGATKIVDLPRTTVGASLLAKAV
ncbi:hypothetical protein BK675_16560 [Pseudomonas fluorescens]|nr:hypothetical protein BK677_10125 [Pseudomonas fluorescens]ROO06126.1 hypothetical protein BK675_16560 [Pseudomonas fluorescens]ROO16149.1 hypothetical protein BK676_18630 [Pseudomonas fluorescens]